MNARLLILNTVFAAGLVWAAHAGFVQFVFAGDGSYMSYLIATILAASLAGAMFGKTSHLADASWLCETLGFVGTLIGITIGLSNVDIASLQSSQGVIAAGNSLFSGMSTAFCSTITGAVAMLWLWAARKAV